MTDGPRAGVLQARGNQLFAEGHLPEALAAFEAVIALDPTFAPAHHNRGMALGALGRWAEAVEAFDTAIALAPDYAQAFDNRGGALRSLGRPGAALASHDRALALAGDVAATHANRAAALHDLGRPAEALASADRAIALDPGLGQAHHNRAAALYRLARPAEAILSYQRALALDPGDHAARFELGLAHLLLGDFSQGWPLYESRKAVLGDPAAGLAPARAWTGHDDIAGARLLVLAEQGLGDTLQFARFVPGLAALGARVTLRAPRTLAPLLARSLPGVAIVDDRAPVPNHDRHCALMSLPLALSQRGDTDLAAHEPLQPDRDRIALWRERLGEPRRRRIGLAWSGAPYHPDDRNRSIALARLAPLLSADADFVCLQSVIRPEDAEHAARLRVVAPGPALADFDDTAALASLMDLVIAVDTSVAHLAASLGRPTWILLPFAPDWRWSLRGRACPWYPTARLFRQPALGDWEAVIADATLSLRG